MNPLLDVINKLHSFMQVSELLPDFNSTRGVFCAIAWLATLFSCAIFVFSLFFGADSDDIGVDGDQGIDGDAGVFSVRALIGFVLGFGWGGYIAAVNAVGVWGCIGVALLLGGGMFVCVASVLRFIYSLKSDGSLDYSTLVGCQGTVYVTVPPHGAPGGQVQVSHPSQLVTMAAVQRGDEPLPPMTRIEVLRANSYQLEVQSVDFPKTTQR